MIDSLTGMYDGVADKHLMKLNPDPFEKIRSGSKTVELRLFDEKRRMVKVGDFVEFTNNISGEKITVRVIALHKHPSFEDLYRVFKRNLEMEKLGYGSGDNPHPDDMKKYYSMDMQEKYGVVGIEFVKV